MGFFDWLFGRRARQSERAADEMLKEQARIYHEEFKEYADRRWPPVVLPFGAPYDPKRAKK